jgi:hypothetical protein
MKSKEFVILSKSNLVKKVQTILRESHYNAKFCEFNYIAKFHITFVKC